MSKRHFVILKDAALRERENIFDPMEDPPHGDFPAFDLSPLGDMAGSGNLALLASGVGLILVYASIIIAVVMWLIMRVF